MPLLDVNTRNLGSFVTTFCMGRLRAFMITLPIALIHQLLARLTGVDVA
jgi:hypothetical protein